MPCVEIRLNNGIFATTHSFVLVCACSRKNSRCAVKFLKSAHVPMVPNGLESSTSTSSFQPCSMIVEIAEIASGEIMFMGHIQGKLTRILLL